MRRRNPERGNSMVLALIVMSSLAALGSLTALSVQGGLKTSSTDRFQQLATYAAESGAAVAMDYLRAHLDPVTGWTAVVRPGNASVPLLGVSPTPSGFPSNGKLPGDADNPFSPDQKTWYEVTVLNNRTDPGIVPGTDTDWRVVIRSVGHGPQGTVAIIEWEVQATNWTTALTLVSWHIVL